MFSRLSAVVRQGGARATFLVRTATPSASILPRIISTSQQSCAEKAPAVNTQKTVLEYYKDVAGLSAPTVLGIGLATYLLSKEIFVINEEALLLVLVAGTLTVIVKKTGKQVGDMLDAQSQAILDSMNQGKNQRIEALKNAIAAEEEVEKVFACRGQVFDIMEENNKMRLEVEYRNRLHEVHDEIKKRLDYQLDLENLEARLEREHVVNWIENAVVQSITPQQEKDALAQCIKDLNGIKLA